MLTRRGGHLVPQNLAGADPLSCRGQADGQRWEARIWRVIRRVDHSHGLRGLVPFSVSGDHRDLIYPLGQRDRGLPGDGAPRRDLSRLPIDCHGLHFCIVRRRACHRDGRQIRDRAIGR